MNKRKSIEWVKGMFYAIAGGLGCFLFWFLENWATRKFFPEMIDKADLPDFWTGAFVMMIVEFMFLVGCGAIKWREERVDEEMESRAPKR